MNMIQRVLLAVLIAMSSIANVAAEHLGVITLYTLTPQAVNPERRACITMQPSIPGTGYACLYASNPLYNELNALLLTMYATKNPACGIEWSGEDVNGHKILANINCY